MKKRILSLLLAAVMSIGLLSVTAFAASDLADVSISNGMITVENGVEGSYLVTILDGDGKAIGFEAIVVAPDGTANAGTTYTDAVSVGHSIPRGDDPAPVEHTHSWATEWSHDEDGHWHACTADDCDITDYATCGEAGAAYGKHAYDNASDTTCNTCDYVRTVTPPVTTYTITASAGDGGRISPSGSVSVNEGGSQTFTISANSNYTIKEVLVDGVSNGKISSYTFSNVTGNHTIAASFTYTPPVVDDDDDHSGGGGGGPTTYAITVEDAANGDVTVKPTRASSGATVTLTVDPETGYELDELIVTDRNGKEIDLTDKGNGKYTFKMPSGKVTVEASFKQIAPVTPDPVNPFVDVEEGTYFYDAVLWAVENGVTNGTSTTAFSPDADCTRAQIVTFLWRAAGSPAPTTMVCPFTDVDMDGYYGEAVPWAVENGITNGTSADTFSPDAICTRAQIVTFLWRAAGSPEPASTVCPFTDVDVDSYYGKAVLWAVENGITNGTSATTFSPNDNCTRAQIVTFLWRFMGN